MESGGKGELSNKKKFTVLGLLFGKQEDYIRRLGPTFTLALFLFIFSMFMGFLLGDKVPINMLEGLLANIPDPADATGIEMFSAIYTNNIVACLMFLVSGVILGVPPIMFLVFNGFIVGWVSYLAAAEESLLYVFLALAPHGIIEIPTITLCAAMGVGLGYSILNKFRSVPGFQAYLGDSVKVFVMRVLPFLALAAAIETALIMFAM